MTRRHAALPLLAGLLLVAGLSSGLTAADPALTIHRGGNAIRLDWALDEVELVGRPGAAVPATAAVAANIQSHARGAKGTLTSSDRKGYDAAVKELAALPEVAAVYAVAYPPGSPRTAAYRHVITREVILTVRPGTDVPVLAKRHALEDLRPVPGLPDAWIGRCSDPAPARAVAVADAVAADPEVLWAEPKILIQHQRRVIPNDPLFTNQWHLLNDGQGGGVVGEDIRVTGAWDSYTGAGVNIAIVDGGVQVAHPDLAARARTDIDIDINFGDLDPTPDFTDDNHGTFVAGCAVASDNSIGGVGVAHGAGLVGIRLISAAAGDDDEALAMGHQSGAGVPVLSADQVMVSNNSWGAPDDGATLGVPGSLMSAALTQGVNLGRSGRGIVYVWACGNGGDDADNASYDGYLNHRVIPVAATNHFGERSSYSETGPNVHVTAPGGDARSGMGIVSADRTGRDGYSNGNYTAMSDGVQGTSFSTPIVSGVCALVLQANPLLTWRDVQHVLAATARQNDQPGGTWVNNGAGYHFSHSYGFGMVHATNATALATQWNRVPALEAEVPLTSINSIALPDNGTPVTWSPTASVPSDFILETVDLRVDITHPYRGQVEIRVISPQGSVSVIANRRRDDNDDLAFTFSGLRTHWGENPNGTWRVQVRDLATGDFGTVNSLSLQLRGFRLPPVPVITSVSPSQIPDTFTDTVITITGSGFVRDAAGTPTILVAVGGQQLPATVTGPGTLTATIPGAVLASVSSLDVQLVNPGVLIGHWTGVTPALRGGGTSAALAIGLNSAPVISPDGIYEVTMDVDGTPTGFAHALSASDPEGDPLSWVLATAPGHGVAVVSGSGTTPVITYVPAAGWNGIDSFVVRVLDDHGRIDEVTIQVTVQGAIDVPTIATVADQVMNEDTLGPAIAISIGDTDTPVASLTLVASAVEPLLVPGTGFTFSGSGADRTLRIRPGTDRNGVTTVTVTVSDGTHTASRSFRLEVRPVNDPPVNTQAPQIPLSASSAARITATPGVWNDARDGGGPLAITYQWLRVIEGIPQPITGATAQSYTAGLADLGRQLRVVETATDAGLASATAASGLVTIAAPTGRQRWVLLDPVPAKAWTLVTPDLDVTVRPDGSEVGPISASSAIILDLMPQGGN